MASAMEKALIKQGMPDKTARKEAKARIEAMKIAKIRKQEKKRLKKKILESMVWEDRENRIFERRETEPRVQQKGWHRERILRGTWDFENVNPANSTPGNGMSSEHHLSKYQPKMNIPPQSIEGTVDNEGEGGTLKEGTVLSTASKSLNSFMPLYAEAMRIHRVTRVSTGFGHTICCTDQGACLTFGRGKDGQLGHSKSQDQFTPAVIESLREVFVIDVGAGLSHSCVISRPSDRLIFCFGDFSFNWLPMETVRKADLDEVSWSHRKQLTGNLRNSYGNVSVRANWAESLVWIFILLGGFAGILWLIIIIFQ